MKECAQQQERFGSSSASTLVEGEDYYSEGAAIVFTARFLLRRGYCCESGCRHCPYTESGEMNPRSIPSSNKQVKEEDALNKPPGSLEYKGGAREVGGGRQS